MYHQQSASVKFAGEVTYSVRPAAAPQKKVKKQIGVVRKRKQKELSSRERLELEFFTILELYSKGLVPADYLLKLLGKQKEQMLKTDKGAGKKTRNYMTGNRRK